MKAKIQYGLRSKVEECPYDIGDLYITLNDTLPSVKWKGTKWKRVEGLVPVGYKESDADFGTLGKTGGAKTVTLTEEQIPEHGHQAKAKKAGNHKHGIALKTATGSATPHTGAGIKEAQWSIYRYRMRGWIKDYVKNSENMTMLLLLKMQVVLKNTITYSHTRYSTCG